MSVNTGKSEPRRASAKPKRPFAERNGALMTPEEVADELACTERHVRRLIDEGYLPRARVGKKLVRVHRDDVADFIARQRGQAN
jgi:excisionase family DNA binding protein